MLSTSAVFKAMRDRTEVGPPPGFRVGRVESATLVSEVQALVSSIGHAARTGAEAWAAVTGDGTFASWCMLATPESEPPSHLPSMKGRYWIWHCRTREEQRGQGLYTAVLGAMVDRVWAADATADVFVDASPDNVAALSAIRKAGFERIGTAICVRVPKTRFAAAVLVPPGRI